MNRYYKEEFESIVSQILSNKEFLKTKDKSHHGITRYEHLMRVSYYSYFITKILRLNYKETARAGLLHDFFLDEVKDENGLRAGTKKSYTYQLAKKGYSLEKTISKVMKKFPDAKEVSIKQWHKRAQA